MLTRQLMRLICVSGSVILLCSAGHCTNETENARALLKPHVDHIQSWEQTAGEILTLNITLGVLGVVTGLLQKSQKKLG